MKKALSFILAAVMAVGSLAGCGGAQSAEADTFRIGGTGPTTACMEQCTEKQ